MSSFNNHERSAFQFFVISASNVLSGSTCVGSTQVLGPFSLQVLECDSP